MGHVDGRRRQDLAGERGRRARPGQLPDSHSVRRLHGARPVGSEFRDSVGRADARRHAGRVAARSHADGSARSFHVDDRTRSRPQRSVPGGSERRPAVPRSGGTIHPSRQDREDRRHHAGAQRLSGIRVRDQHGSAVPPGEHQDGAGRRALHRGHVPRHHPGRELDGAWHVPPLQDSAVPARQGHQSRPHLAFEVRRRAGGHG